MRSEAAWYQETRDLYYGLPVQVSYAPENAELSKSVWNYLEQIDLIFNDFKPDSEISRINRNARMGTIQLSAELSDGFEKAKKAYKFSEGVFDISCGPLRRLWRDAGKTGEYPSDAAIESIQSICGLQNIHLEGNELQLNKVGMQFDFGGIIKGIAADRVVNLLKAGGATSALIQIGGETAAFGHSKKDRPYRIAIQHPLDPYGRWCVIHSPTGELSGSTSGNYEKPILIDGKTYYHIFDPRTGRPAQTQVASVSVIFPETGKNWLTDSLTTTGVLLGPEKTIDLVTKMGGEALFIILGENGLHEIKSDGWDAYEL